MSSTEKLLGLIKNHPILFDLTNPDYKDVKKKDKIWETIGGQLGEKGDAVKKKWKNLRDSYSRHLRSLKTSTCQCAIPMEKAKSWQWAKQIEFVKPFLNFARTESNIEIPESEGGCSADGQQTEVDIPSNFNAVKRRRRNGYEKQPSVENVLDYLGKKTSSKCDPTEQLFLGFARTVKTFSMRRQTLVKIKISQLILEEELNDWEERPSVIILNPNFTNN